MISAFLDLIRVQTSELIYSRENLCLQSCPAGPLGGLADWLDLHARLEVYQEPVGLEGAECGRCWRAVSVEEAWISSSPKYGKNMYSLEAEICYQGNYYRN